MEVTVGKSESRKAQANNKRGVFGLLLKLLNVMVKLAAVAILSLMVIIVAEITSRSMNSPIMGATDIGSFLLVALVFLALAATQSERGHVSMDAVVAYFPERLKVIADKLGLVVCLGVGIILLWGTSQQALESFHRGELSLGSMAYPLWPSRALVALGFLSYDLVVIAQIFGFHAEEEFDLASREYGAD